MSTTTSTAAAQAAAPAGEPAKVRLRDALRDNGLATVAILLVLGVAVAGWSASFISLHEFALKHMGLTSRPAWLVPSTFDGAALGLSLLSFRAAIYGRASLGSMLYVYGFTALSSWINWVHIDDKAGGKFVSALLPIAAVVVFGKVLKEAREAYERRHGKVVFKVRGGLLLLRMFVDRKGTREAVRQQILDIPVQALIGLGAGNLAREAAEQLAGPTEEKAGGESAQTDPGEASAQSEVLALLRQLLTEHGHEVFERVNPAAEVHTETPVQAGSERPAVNPPVNLPPFQRPAMEGEQPFDRFTTAQVPHQINRAANHDFGSQDGQVPAESELAVTAEIVNQFVNPDDEQADEPETAEVHTRQGLRPDAKTSQAMIQAGWLNGDSPRSIAERTGRSQGWIYRQLRALDEEHGPRQRKDDTAEIPAITAANGFDLTR